MRGIVDALQDECCIEACAPSAPASFATTN
jgi:hypothetical protein